MKLRKPTANFDHDLKILAFFVHRYRWGEQIRGDERGFLEKARQYKKLGVTVYAVETEHSLQEHLNESIYDSIKTPVHMEAPRGPTKQLVTLFNIILATLRLSLRFDPDLIYAYNQDIVNVMPAYLLKLVYRKPLVIIFHLIRPKEMMPFKDAISGRLKKGFSPLAALLASFLDMAVRFIYRRADCYITVSQAVKNDLAIYLKIHKVAVAGNGVNSKKFRPHDLEKIYDAAFLGRLHPQKGIEVLLKAWKMIVTKNSSAKLVLIGGGNKSDTEHYRTLIHTLGINENVEMKGFVPDEELVRLLNSSKIFVFPSLYDGFANAVAEAMACGLPCVISNIPALRENYGEASVLVEPNDVQGLKEAIVKLLKSEKRREELRKRGRERVKMFDWKDVVRKELEVIRELRRDLP